MELFNKKEKYVPVEGIISEATDYNVYIPNTKEKVTWALLGAVVSGAVLYLFYENIFVSLIAGIILGICFIPIRTNQVIKKRKQKLTLQFRSLLDALATSIGAGRNVFDSFTAAYDDLAVQYTAEADIVEEVKIICSGLNNNIAIEDLLLNFGIRSGIEDIRTFSNVFATCYKKGGNIKDVIKNTASIIGDKIEIRMELETMVASQKNDQNIMLVMPMIFIVVMKSMGGDLIDLTSPSGRLSVTISLVIFVIAYFIGQKITDIKI